MRRVVALVVAGAPELSAVERVSWRALLVEARVTRAMVTVTVALAEPYALTPCVRRYNRMKFARMRRCEPTGSWALQEQRANSGRFCTDTGTRLDIKSGALQREVTFYPIITIEAMSDTI